MLELSESLMDKWTYGDVFKQVLSLKGKLYRFKDNRKTLLFSHNGDNYFAKIHLGVGWKKIIKYLFQLKFPVLSAKNEWLAVQHLERMGINTTPIAGYGRKGINPAKIRSFIITKELNDIESLEDFSFYWNDMPPEYTLKKALIIKVAEIARIIHENNISHRDFYICHFLIDISAGIKHIKPKEIKLYLIDLHRVQVHRRLPKRLQIKDIAGLYFSCMDIGLTKRDLFRFVRAYKNKPLKTVLFDEKNFWEKVNHRGIALYEKTFEKIPSLPV